VEGAEGVTARRALHASGSVELYTPGYIADASRVALGGEISYDPASCAFANKVIKARCYSDESDDSLNHRSWDMGNQVDPAIGCAVFLNPPGGTLDKETLEPMPRDSAGKQRPGGVSAAAVWWIELVTRWRRGQVGCAVFHCFRLDVLQTLQGKRFAAFRGPLPQEVPFCVYAKRPKHYTERGAGKSPTHACAAFFLPELRREALSVERFERAFSPLGIVRV
jgi:hypothetical protein